ncbi:tyrosine-protein phosphatase [Staphylococcus simulans]|uniref:tyrosine-protein phosphatase n=1 Tax=Staphylococcus simulans TaxID=1286 RepID=UPI003F7E9379
MIDIHDHIIFDIDDGPKTMEESIEMARYAASVGIDKIITTPHFKTKVFESDKDEILYKVKQLNEKFKELGIDIELKGGQEIHLDPYFMTHFNNNKLLTLGQSHRYILLELPFDSYPYYIDELIDFVIERGYSPIIAHPERNAVIREELHRLDELAAKGCLLQMNAASILGDYGESTKNTAQYMIAHKKFHIIGSDAHNNNKRIFCIDQCYNRIENHEFKTYVMNNSERIWQNREIDANRYFK